MHDRTPSHSIRSPPLSTWLRLVVGLVGLWPLFGCWTLADVSNHHELDPPLAQRLAASSPKQHLPFAIMVNVIRDQEPQNDHHELSPEQIQLIEQIFVAGLNESDYLLNVLEPRLYKEGVLSPQGFPIRSKFHHSAISGHTIKKGDPAAGVAAFNYQQSTTKEFARYGFATLKAYALLREK